MKNIFLLLVGTLLWTGCMHNYDITLVNGMKITGVSKPKLDKKSGVYMYKNVKGTKESINASRVVEIAPHHEEKAPKTPKVNSF